LTSCPVVQPGKTHRYIKQMSCQVFHLTRYAVSIYIL
jgi:hypothetical protein